MSVIKYYECFFFSITRECDLVFVLWWICGAPRQPFLSLEYFEVFILEHMSSAHDSLILYQSIHIDQIKISCAHFTNNLNNSEDA